MDDVAHHLGCHVEEIDFLINPQECESEFLEWE